MDLKKKKKISCLYLKQRYEYNFNFYVSSFSLLGDLQIHHVTCVLSFASYSSIFIWYPGMINRRLLIRRQTTYSLYLWGRKKTTRIDCDNFFFSFLPLFSSRFQVHTYTYTRALIVYIFIFFLFSDALLIHMIIIVYALIAIALGVGRAS